MPRVVSAIMFSPRGGSAYAARALSRGLRARGWDVTLLAGSRGDLGADGSARSFYGQVVEVRFDSALASVDPLRFDGPAGTAPLHPSFEDRPAAPDLVFAAVDDFAFEFQVRAWARELERVGAAAADVLHLHHLTPLNEAAARVAPRVPVVGQLHGSELLMLERIAAGAPLEWRHADRWATRLRSWAQQCARIVVVAAGLDRAAELLEVPREQFVAIPNGVDLELFRRVPIDRRRFWREMLAERPRGWLPGQGPGSASYSGVEAHRLADAMILLYVGRFTAVKRLDRLIEAYARVRQRVTRPVGLVLVGGHPGEFEGEHPATIAASTGANQVFLAGWYEHDQLARFYSAADALVMTSEREQFGLVLIEAMACGLPVVSARTLGPASIIDHGATGWLVEPGDETALVETLVEVIHNAGERERRGQLARVSVGERFTWSSAAEQLSELLAEVGVQTPRSERAQSLPG